MLYWYYKTHGGYHVFEWEGDPRRDASKSLMGTEDVLKLLRETPIKYFVMDGGVEILRLNVIEMSEGKDA